MKCPQGRDFGFGLNAVISFFSQVLGVEREHMEFDKESDTRIISKKGILKDIVEKSIPGSIQTAEGNTIYYFSVGNGGYDEYLEEFVQHLVEKV